LLESWASRLFPTANLPDINAEPGGDFGLRVE
jgi:hypothetical protein